MQLSGTVLFGLEVVLVSITFRFFFLIYFSIFLEWGLSTQFNATNEFLKKWADAQKFSYSKGAGWLVSYFFFFSIPLKKKDITNEFFFFTL
jgi:hypothetical protein